MRFDPRNIKAATAALLALTLGLGVAACGSSTAPGVVPAPQGGATADTTSATPTTGTSTTASNAVKVPSSGPLSAQPVFTVPTGTPSRTLIVRDLVKGTGATAQKGDQLWVSYVGKLYSNGKIFDSSWKDTPGQAYGPFQLGVGAVVKGWDLGLVGMKVGGRRELIIPPKLAYGAKGSGSVIPPNATLVFVVDLLKVSK